jgi:hypothetical protein
MPTEAYAHGALCPMPYALRAPHLSLERLYIDKSAQAQLRTYKSKVGSIAHNMDRTCAANLVSQTKSVVTAI